MNSSCSLRLPTIIECDQLPDARDEIPSPEAAKAYKHMYDIAEEIPPLNPDAEILLLIGRDLLPAHHVLDQRLGKNNTPYAQQLRLGWVVIGEACLGATHEPDAVSAYKTFTLIDGRASLLQPCQNNLLLKEIDVFIKTDLDDTPGLSVEDKKFLHIMETGITKDYEGCWSMPLPFKEHRSLLPKNRIQALKRANLLKSSLNKNPQKRNHVIEFMQKIFSNGHAEIAPPLAEDEEHWYLPLFAVYHPKKPDKVRCVFDSSAKCQGLSLNDVLLTGPDLMNNLLGILMRFRQRPVAVTADIEQMFYRFSVPPVHRNYLRFLWHRDNDMNQELIEYRMKRHVFGNSPSPAIATLGLCKTAEKADPDVKHFVEENFYVDDGLTSVDSVEEAVSLLSRTQDVLHQEGNIRLHKIISNYVNVLNAFPKEDLAKDITTFNLELSETPPQRSLGVSWNIARDTFTFQVSKTTHPFTKRGVLATINSLYDPIGFLAPVVIRGKLIMRDVMSAGLDWDEPLPPDYFAQWSEWRESLPLLENVSIPRKYADIPSTSIIRRELHVFADASQKAIAAVAYLKIFDVKGRQHIGFVYGKAKVAPLHGHTIPRLELCAAVLATQLKNSVVRNLDIQIIDVDVTMYSDSQVVLGYINNEQRRFYVYVDNRVSAIRQSTNPSQWTYVPSEINPADIATRSVSSSEIGQTAWLYGPSFLSNDTLPSTTDMPCNLINPNNDKEIRPIITLHTRHGSVSKGIGVHRLERFSQWLRLVEAVAKLKHVAKSYARASKCRHWNVCPSTSDELHDAQTFILKEVQRECFFKEVKMLMEGRAIPETSPIVSLSPFMDADGLMRVGGRLTKGKDQLDCIDVNPILVPKNSHIALLLIRHYHNQVQHQGRQMTEGRLRTVGLWIVGVKRLIASVLRKCVICRKLRGSFCAPKMADLPVDRLSPGPPFTFVGLDTFGPWNVIARRTRGGHAAHKRWVVLFTCLASRAVHIEVIQELSSSSFINALRRFLAIRGPVRQFRSDRGTNFIGAVQELGIPSVFIEEQTVQTFMRENACTWIFNPPHASHFGGVWERMIGVSRRILDAMLLRSGGKELTHEILSTFLAEVCAIINSRPLAPISEDPSDPTILTPSTLLTQKVGNLPESLPSLGTKDLYKAQWRHVQVLAKEFWKKWQKEYLCALQSRQKWTSDPPNIKEGDIVLLREYDTCRNRWPMAIVSRTFPATDGRVREVEICVSKSGKHYVRPVHELVLLLE